MAVGWCILVIVVGGIIIYVTGPAAAEAYFRDKSDDQETKVIQNLEQKVLQI